MEEETSRPSPPTGSVESFVQSPSGRPYRSFRSSESRIITTMGVLLPDKYHVDEDSYYPYVCPVRTCKTSFSTLQGVDVHFYRNHEGMMFNDNLDGTLSLVGRREGEGKLPAIIVTQKPQGPEGVTREPSLPSEPPYDHPTAQNETPIPERETEGQEKRPPSSCLYSTHNQHEHERSTSAMVENFSELAMECYSTTLENDRGGKTDPQTPAPGTILVASSVPTPELSTGPSERESENETENHGASVPTRRSLRIILKKPQEGPEPPATPVTSRRENQPESSQSAPRARSAALAQERLDDSDEEPTSPATRRSNRLRVQRLATQEGTSHGPPTSVSTKVTTPKQSSSKKRRCKSDSSEDKSASGSTKRAVIKRREFHVNTPPKFNLPSSTLVPNAVVPPAPSASARETVHNSPRDELETWELAPGRIRKGKDNIAFSSTYLRRNKAVPIHTDTAFNVVVIEPGTMHRIEASPDKLRLVSIATGKVRATMSDEVFTMNINGAIRVLPNTDCAIQNRFPADATVHIYTQKQP